MFARRHQFYWTQYIYIYIYIQRHSDTATQPHTHGLNAFGRANVIIYELLHMNCALGNYRILWISPRTHTILVGRHQRRTSCRQFVDMCVCYSWISRPFYVSTFCILAHSHILHIMVIIRQRAFGSHLKSQCLVQVVHNQFVCVCVHFSLFLPISSSATLHNIISFPFFYF